MDIIWAIAAFMFVMSATPGPNNLLLLSSGIRFGVKATFPHIAGIQLGMGAQLALSCYGIGNLLLHSPTALLVLKILGTLYLLYLAWGLRSIAINDDDETRSASQHSHPFTFIQAFSFQFVNPKAWVMSIMGTSIWMPAIQHFEQVQPSLGKIFATLALVVLFITVAAPCSFSWTIFGASLKNYLTKPLSQKLLSIFMMSLLAYALTQMWMTSDMSAPLTAGLINDNPTFSFATPLASDTKRALALR